MSFGSKQLNLLYLLHHQVQKLKVQLQLLYFDLLYGFPVGTSGIDPSFLPTMSGILSGRCGYSCGLVRSSLFEDYSTVLPDILDIPNLDADLNPSICCSLL